MSRGRKKVALLVLMLLESQGAYVLVPHDMEILFHEFSTIGEDREALFSFSIAGDVVPMRIETSQRLLPLQRNLLQLLVLDSLHRRRRHRHHQILI